MATKMVNYIFKIALILSTFTACLSEYCTQNSGTLYQSTKYCRNGCCYDTSIADYTCCIYSSYNYAGRYYWGIGSGISAFVGITVGVCVYLCCRKKQRTANTIQNGPLSTVTYGNTGVQTSQMPPGVNYPMYPGQQNMSYTPYPEKPVEPPQYAADPPTYESVVNSK